MTHLELPKSLLQLCLVPRDDGDVRAALRKEFRDGEAGTRGPPSHEATLGNCKVTYQTAQTHVYYSPSCEDPTAS